MVLDSRKLFETLNLAYYYREEEGCEPTRTNVRFAELLPELKESHLGTELLYLHQLQAVEALEAGKNLVLIAGTGSGKTEAWFLYTARRRIPTLALYPTLALANDQVQRLSNYCSLLGVDLLQLDSPTLQS
ncbi:MAG: DEAD/DEAH box helicase, partial [Thermofilaceae archaeon]